MHIVESEDFFDAEIFMQPLNNEQLSDEGNDTEKGTDVQNLSSGQHCALPDFRIDFGSYVVDSILTQEEKLHNVDEEECGSNDEPHNSMNLANEKWLSQQIPTRKNCNWKKEEVSDTQFGNIQMPMPSDQENMTPLDLFGQLFDDDVISFVVNMSNLYANRHK